MARRPELVGIAEIADLFGVRRNTAWRWAQREGFPEPLARLASGPVWSRADIEGWRPPDVGPQVLAFVIETRAGVQRISISRRILERFVLHLRATGTPDALAVANGIAAETQLHTGSTELRLAPGEDEAVLRVIPIVRAEGFGLKQLDRLDRELASAIEE
jgi:predicted DNA-binding transcriptional regulator AlpA